MRPPLGWCVGCAPELVRWVRELQEENRHLAARVRSLEARLRQAHGALEASGLPVPRDGGRDAAPLAGADGGTQPWWMPRARLRPR
jgi:hypothetical protein